MIGKRILIAAALMFALPMTAQAQQRFETGGYARVVTDPTKPMGKVDARDGAGNPITSTTAGGKTMFDVTIRDAATGLPAAVGGGGGGGGGGSVTVGDAADVTQGAIADAACATDNGACTSQALLKRLNQRVTAAITALGSPAQASGQATTNTSLGSIDTKLSSQATATAQAAAQTSLTSMDARLATSNTNTASVDTKLTTTNTNTSNINTSVQAHVPLLGAVNETAPGTDVASSGLNGRLQRIAQNLSTLNSNVNGPIPAGTNDIGDVGLVAHTGGGATPFKIIAAASTNSTSVKGTAGKVFTIAAYGIHATAPAFLKLYNKATAPTCGTDVPVETHVIPTDAKGGGGVVPTTVGLQFSLGIGVCITGGLADTDTTAVAAASYVVNIRFK